MARLPFDPERIDGRPTLYDQRSWRETPNIRVSRTVDRDLDLISMELANEISEKAPSNAIRIFHYNMMSRDNWRNRDFERLVQLAAEFIDMMIASKQIREPTDNLIKNIETIAALHSCKQVKDFPELERVFAAQADSRGMRVLDTNVVQYERLLVDLNEFLEQDVRDTDRHDVRSQYAGASRSERGFPRDDRYGARYPERNAVRNVSAREAGGEYSSDRKVFSRDDDRYDPRSPMPSSREYIGRQANNEGYRFVPQPVNGGREQERREFHDNRASSEYSQPIRREAQRSEPEVVKVAASTQEKPNFAPDVPRFTGINSTSFPILNEQTMDILDHSKVYDLNDIPERSKEMRAEVLRVLSLAQAIEEPGVSDEEIKDNLIMNEPIEIFDSVSSMVNCLSDEGARTIIAESGDNKEGVRKIIHSLAVVDNSIVGFRHLNTLRAQLEDSTTFKEVVSRLRDAKAKVVSVNAEAAYVTDIRAAVDYYDRILTAEFNSYFRDVLKMGDKVIDSIVDDFDELMGVMSDHKDPTVTSFFLEFITNFNGNLVECRLPENKTDRAIKDSGILNEDTGFTTLPISYLVTFLPFTQKELGLELKESAAVYTTGDGGFIRAALSLKHVEMPEVFLNCIRLMVTRDRQVLRVYRYPKRADVVILSRYNQ